MDIEHLPKCVEAQHTGVTTDARLQRCRNWTVSYIGRGGGGGGLTSSHVLLPTAFVHVPTTCTRLTRLVFSWRGHQRPVRRFCNDPVQVVLVAAARRARGHMVVGAAAIYSKRA